MKNYESYNVDGWNNFCRVFEFPEKFSNEFCFGGGIPTTFKMVDWFNPVSGIPQPTVSKEIWIEKLGPIKVEKISISELCEKLIPFLNSKSYVKKNRKYIVICDFGASFVFTHDSSLT